MRVVDLSKGMWVKAALHAHSTCSDGRIPPERVVDYYVGAGYGVVSITDHEKITRTPGGAALTLPGCEVSRPVKGRDCHLVLVGPEELPPQSVKDAAGVVEWARSQGLFAFVAHPYWSMLSGYEILDLGDAHGVEVYNHGCEVEISRGFSEPQLDYLLHNTDRAVYCLAVDDAHNYSIDGNGGWVYLNVGDFTVDEALKSLLNGRFFSSSGPLIKLLEISGGRIYLECSPALKVNIVSGDTKGLHVDARLLGRVDELGSLGIAVEKWLEEGLDSYRITMGKTTLTVKASGGLITVLEVAGELPASKYVRIEVVEPGGEKAWSNPVKV